MPKTTVLTDGSFDFSGGVDSSLVTTVRSPSIPRGLRRDQLAWLTNATVRGGGILQRTGDVQLVPLVAQTGLWQGGYMYDPYTANPYQICSISGNIYKVLLDPPYTVTDLSKQFNLFNPGAVDQAFFCQGEEFLVIQAGDGQTAPLFWDGTTLWRSKGILGAGNPANELPPAYMMVYYAQRIWYAQGLFYAAGDLVAGPSGTAKYGQRDSILKVTENPLASGGDGFRLPTYAGTIRALAYSASTDTTQGQGPLYIFTRKKVFSLTVPFSRADWIASTSSNQPVQTVAQFNNGAVSDRGITHVNGDLFYQSLDPAIRSFVLATRFFQQWGNKPISSNLQRALQFNDRSLMRFSSGIYFDNRMLQLILPQKHPNGSTIHKAIAALDFDIISSIITEDASAAESPAWEGIREGNDYLQIFNADFGGLDRAFQAIVSRQDGTIQIWEMTTSSRTDRTSEIGNNEERVTWSVESPAFNFNQEFELKKLSSGELWLDKISGSVNILVEYRPDADPCWKKWYATTVCAARTCAEDVSNPACYPPPQYREGWKWTVSLPDPPVECGNSTGSKRPTNVGFQFQVRVTIKGWCRIRGLVLYAEPRERALYDLECP